MPQNCVASNAGQDHLGLRTHFAGGSDYDMSIDDGTHQSLTGHISKWTSLSKEFLIATGVINQFPENTFESEVRPIYWYQHGDLVRLAYRNLIYIEDMIENFNFEKFQNLSADSLYQLHNTRIEALDEFIDAAGCSHFQKWRVYNAITSNFTKQLEFHRLFQNDESLNKEFKSAINYAGYLHEQFGEFHLSDDVTVVLNRLMVLNSFNSSPAVRKLAHEHFAHTVEILADVFHRQLHLVRPVVDRHINFCRDEPEHLETVYLCPEKFISRSEAAKRKVYFGSKSNMSKFLDAFRSLVEIEVEKQCPSVNPQIAVSCFQAAAYEATQRLIDEKSEYYIFQTAKYALSAMRIATTWIP